MYKLTILGQTPSKKNSKQLFKNSKTGKMFITSSDKTKAWDAQALKQLKEIDYRIRGKIKVDYKFFVKDNLQRDLDNMITSVNDILQLANCDYAPNKKGKMKPVKGTGIIAGDHWQVLSIGSAKAQIDKENPRCEISIDIIDEI